MSSQVNINQLVPNFQLPATSNLTFQLSNFTGKNLILYFYPKDSTPGCTTQGIQFRDHFETFIAHNTVIFGISRDSLKSHENFKTKFSFPFELLSDTEEQACAFFDVIKLKNMYGKQVRGIERSTFIIDKNGVLIKEWRKVKVNGHVEEVLSFVQSQPS